MNEDYPILDQFNQLLIERAGICFSQNSQKNLLQRIEAKVAQLELRSAQEYYQLLLCDDQQFEAFLDLITTNFSYFYRETAHYEVLKAQIIPELRERGRNSLRIWSAGCSTGEEPYTLAMLLDDIEPKLNVEILATDISRTCIAIARQGVYPAKRLEKLPHELIKRYMSRLEAQDIEQFDEKTAPPLLFYKIAGGDEKLYRNHQGRQEEFWRVDQNLRDRVRFVKHNLVTHSYSDFIPPYFDIIFCRNVLIYFPQEIQERVANQFGRVLAKDGYLFLGHAEYLHHMNTPFVPYDHLQPFCYTFANNQKFDDTAAPFNPGVDEQMLNDLRSRIQRSVNNAL